jgi:hypothetical protein
LNKSCVRISERLIAFALVVLRKILPAFSVIFKFNLEHHPRLMVRLMNGFDRMICSNMEVALGIPTIWADLNPDPLLSSSIS